MPRLKGSKNKKTLALVSEIELTPSVSLNEAPTIVIDGWVNIQTSQFRELGVLKQGYYLGGDIHNSLESAKRSASNNTIGQVRVQWSSN